MQDQAGRPPGGSDRNGYVWVRVETDASFDATALALWSRRYARLPLDVIVANGAIELDLAVRLRARLARDIPIVYRVSASTPSQQFGRLATIPFVTGIVDAPLVGPVIADLRRLSPTLRDLLLVTQSECDLAFVRAESDSLLSGVTLHPWFAASMRALQDSVRRLPPEVKAAVFRIVQEALTNVHRHAQATEAAVLLRRVGATLEVTVRDDGIGFDPATATGARLGLLGMQERARAVGGHLVVTAAPDDGTSVTLIVPLPAPT